MKRIIHAVLIIWVFIISTLFSNAQVMDLPLEVDFNKYTGTNLSEAYEGWVEGSGYPTPSLGSGTWFQGSALYKTTTATVAVNDGSHKEWIVSPDFKVTENTCVFFKASISYDYNYPMESELSSDDEFAVYISEDGGSSFTKIQEFGDELEYDLKQFHAQLANYKDKTVRVGFFVSDGQIDNSKATVHLDDIKIKDVVDTDIAVNSFYISEQIEQGKELSLKVELTNEGLEQINIIPLRIDIRGAENLTELIVVDDELAFADNKEIFLKNIKLSKSGNYTVTITSTLIDDGDSGNDSFTEGFSLASNNSIPLETLDFKYSYEDIGFYDGWKEAIGDTNVISYVRSAWRSDVYSDQSSFYAPYFALGSMDWIISPSFNVDEKTYLYFNAAVELIEGSTAMGSDDKLIIYVTEDGGQTWKNIGEINKDNFSTTWDKSYFFDLSAYSGSTIKVGLFATTGKVKDSEVFNLHIDNVTIKNYETIDISIEEIVGPNKKPVFGAEETIAVKLINKGKEDINSFSVSYILNEGAEVKENVNQVIKSQESYTYYFTTKADLTGDDNTITVKAELENDSDLSNNELIDVELTTYSFDPILDGKYIQSFEDSEDYSSWVIIDGNNDGSTWELYHDGGSYDFDGYYNFRYSSKNTTVQSDEWLISNGFYLKAGVEYSVSFYFANKAAAMPEKLKFTMGQEQTIIGQSIELVDFGTITNNNYLKAEKTITVTTDGYYYFGWNDYGDPSKYAVMIDKIIVQKKYNNDLSVNRLFFPKSIDYTSNVLDSIRKAYVEIENQSVVGVSTIPLKLELNNGVKQLTLEFNINQNLNVGEKARLVLESDEFKFDIEKPITAKLYINDATDEYHLNDTLIVENYNHYNYYTSFEYADETESWIIVDEDDGGHTWKRSEDKKNAKSGKYYYTVYTNAYTGYKENIDWLITDGLYLEESGCYKIKFWYKNYYSKENLKLFLGKSYDPEDLTNKIFEVELNDIQNKYYSEADLIINVEESGIYYLGFLSDREIDKRYYIMLDDFSLEKMENYTPELEIATEQIYNHAICKLENPNANVKFWEWTLDDISYANESIIEHDFENNGTYTIRLTAGNQCVTSTKEQEIAIDYSVANDFDYTINDKTVVFDLDETNINWVSWNFGDGANSNEISPSNTYADYGSYDVSVNVYSVLNSLNITKTIKLDNTTGINDLNSDYVKVYPNPASTYINIESKDHCDLKIYTVNGVLVKQTKLEQGNNTIDVSDLKTGLYTITYSNYSSKLIIN